MMGKSGEFREKGWVKLGKRRRRLGKGRGSVRVR